MALNSNQVTTHSTCNLGFIFDEHLTFSDENSSVQISNKKLSKCLDSTTCKPLDAEIISTEVQNSTFIFLARIWDHRTLQSNSASASR